jgi:hypothetical protein
VVGLQSTDRLCCDRQRTDQGAGVAIPRAYIVFGARIGQQDGIFLHGGIVAPVLDSTKMTSSLWIALFTP